MRAAHHADAEPDMFAGTAYAPPPRAADPHVEFEGRVVRGAEVRNRPAGDGLHSVPVVCVEIASLTGLAPQTCHCYYPFTDATRREAEALAKSLVRGRIVTVSTPVNEIHLNLPHVDSIVITPPH